MFLPSAFHCWHVWCYVHTNIQHLFTWQMFSVCTVQWYNLPHVKTVSASLCDSSSHAYATSRSSSLCTDHHTSCRNTACSVFACAANTPDTAVGLHLPLEMPLAVKFSCCEWIINSRMRISRKFLCIILLPHELCIRNAFRMVMSARWKKWFLGSLPCSAGSSIAVDHSVWLVHKPHVGIVVFYNTRFDSLARFRFS